MILEKLGPSDKWGVVAGSWVIPERPYLTHIVIDKGLQEVDGESQRVFLQAEIPTDLALRENWGLMDIVRIPRYGGRIRRIASFRELAERGEDIISLYAPFNDWIQWRKMLQESSKKGYLKQR